MGAAHARPRRYPGRRISRIAVVVLAVQGAMAIEPSASASPPSWSITASPRPSGPSSTAMHGVSCPTSTMCMAVGSTIEGSAVQRWDGTAWAILAKPLGSVRSDRLTSVSCASATSCMVVGYRDGDEFSGTALAERWNGTSWSFVTPAVPAGALSTVFYGVWCSSATNCLAVGDYQSSSQVFVALAERWNGTTWSTVPVGWPTGLSILEGITCTSANDCVAVGRNPDGSNQHTLTERWNGSAWSIVSSPDASGASSSDLRSVSCSIAGDCWAVGSSGPYGSAVIKALAEHFDGVSWTIGALPNNTDGTRDLYGVSCASRTSCIAVGTTFTNRPMTLTERLSGSTWSDVANGVALDTAHLLGVACPTDSNCVAVGSSIGSAQGPIPFESDSDHVPPATTDPQSLVERWNGAAWSLDPIPILMSNSTLGQVACPTSTNCFAVGNASAGGLNRTLIQQWNGNSWATVSSPGAGINPQLNGISCAGPGMCMVVGSGPISQFPVAFEQSASLRWDGTSWTKVDQPPPNPRPDNALDAVSCPTTTWCVAVGRIDDAHSLANGLIETWTGSFDWSTTPNPQPDGASSWSLHGVSCTSSSDCFAVGESFGAAGGQTLVEHWDGVMWSIVDSPTPPSGGFTDLRFSGLSCVSASSCMAVGLVGQSGFAEQWDGTAWSVLETPAPDGEWQLHNVSCASATSCVAVGWATAPDGNTTSTVIATWDGVSWTLESSPNPLLHKRAYLNGVTCTDAAACFAVGGSSTPKSMFTLIERLG